MICLVEAIKLMNILHGLLAGDLAGLVCCRCYLLFVCFR